MSKIRIYSAMPLPVAITTGFACAITSPAAGASVTQGTPVTIQGTISRGAVAVIVKLGSTVLGSASIVGLAWSYSWTPQAGDVGAQTINAVATSPSAEVAPATGVAVTVASSIDFASFFTGGTVLQSVQSDKGVTAGATFTWSDQSGNGKHYTQSVSGKQPTLTAGLSGNPGLRFTAASQQLLTSALNLPAPGTTPTWIGIVWRAIATTANCRPLADTSTGTSQAILHPTGGAGDAGQFNGGFVNSAPFTLNAWECSEFYFSNSASDYVKRGANSPVTGSGAGNATGTGRNIGGVDAVASYTDSEIVHVIYVNSKQPSAITNWRAAVLTKYGVSVSV